jgi:hypothetical protein
MQLSAERKKQVLFWIPIATVILVLFGLPILRGEALFWGLPITQFVPWWVQAIQNLSAGELPFWNPNLGMGAPLLANYQLGFFYPPNWLFVLAGFILGAEGIAWVQAVLICAHLIWAAVGMRRLMNVLGVSQFGGTIAALAYAFSGYLIARAWFLSILWVVTWLPWLSWASYVLIAELYRVQLGKLNWQRDFRRSRLALLAALLTLQLLAGHAQTAWYSGVFLGLWMLFWGFYGPIQAHPRPEVVPAENPSAQRWVLLPLTLIILGVAVLAAIGLASIQLLPTAEYLLQSQRASSVDYETAMTYSFWPWRFLGFIAPNLFGNPAMGDYWGYANFWEDAIYIGLIPFFLATTTLFKLRKLSLIQRRLVLFLWVVTGFAFVMALGTNLPVFPWLFRYIPTFDMFNGPTRWSILAVFSLTMLAGIAAEHWTRPIHRALYWTRLGTAGGVAITCGALAGWLVLGQSADAERLQTMALAIGMTGIWALVGGVLALSAPLGSGQNDESKITNPTRWHFFVVIWIALDLTVAGWGLNPTEPSSLYADSPALFDPLPAGRVYISSEAEYAIKFEKYFQFSTFDSVEDWTLIRQTFLPNIGVLNGNQAAVNNFDPIVPDRFARWLTVLGEADSDLEAILLNLSGVSTVVNKDFDTPSGARLEMIEPGQYLRAFTCQRFYEDKDLLLEHMLADPDTLRSVIFLEGSGSDTITNCEPAVKPKISLVQSGIQRKEVIVETEEQLWLMLTESWYPGWRVTINGQNVALLRADYLFQAVQVPPGTHKVIFEYSPFAFKIGAAISLLALAVVALLIIRAR